MAKLNQNTLAKAVVEVEGGKSELNIAQIKEVIRITIDELSCYNASEVLALLESRRKVVMGHDNSRCIV